MLQVAYVEWFDINHRDGWIELPDDIEPAPVTTVGFVVLDTESFIRLTPCHGGTEGLVTMAIPKGCIKRLEILTLETLLKAFE
jgi:hypothetical protein